MENKPKKSKALIITIIIILLLLVIGYFVVKNRDMFGAKTSASIARIFAPLLSSENSNNLNQVDENSQKTLAQAGEDIKQGDNVSTFGTDANNNPIVMKSGKGDVVYGFANQDINNGEIGEIILNNGGSNSFWNTFSNFLNNLFNNNNNINECTNGATNPPLCTIGGDNECLNGAINPPVCTLDSNNECTNGATNPPLCTIGGDNECLNGAINPPVCTLDSNNECTNGATNPPLCTIFTGFTPQCSDTKDNDADELIDALDPNCHVDGDLTKAYVPTHYSESSSPFTPPDYNNSDLIAGEVTPTSTTINTPTALTAVITNIGEGGTGYNFSSYFTITNISSDDEQNNTVSKSTFKKVLAKILDKLSWVSSALAVNDSVEISVVTPPLQANTSSPIFTMHSFNSSGTYYIRACADKKSSSDTGLITETNEDNNCGEWTTFTVTGSLPTWGDLPVCSDKMDNDKDGQIDINDTACHIDGDLTKEYLPDHYSETRPPAGGEFAPQCSDTLDNDKDNKVDDLDPNCHVDGDLTKAYVPTHYSESSNPPGVEENKCKLIENTPLEFTDVEKARLAVLLRKFYLISSTLRTEDDISTIYNEIDQHKNFMSQIDELTKQCYLETNDNSGFADFCARNKGMCDINPATEFANNANSNYKDNFYGTRTDTKHGNPWFSKPTTGSFPYSNATYQGYLDYNFLEGSNEGERCKYITGYYYGTRTTSDGIKRDCNELNSTENNPWWGDCSHMSTKIAGNYNNPPNENYLSQGCKWKDGVILNDTERILNIW